MAMLTGRICLFLVFAPFPLVSGTSAEVDAVGAQTYAPPSIPVRLNAVQMHIRNATPDTLKQSVRTGDVLIFALPESIDSKPVNAYRIVWAPALSWLVDHSFFWRTRPADTGRHEILFGFNPTIDAPVDTLVVVVEVSR